MVVPTPTPLNKPVLVMVAIAVLEVDQLPPGSEFLSLRVSPWHTLSAPVMLPTVGNGNTLNMKVLLSAPQLLVTLYLIVVVPADTALTVPVLLTVATLVTLLVQVPPAEPEALSEIVPPTQVLSVPVMLPALGKGFIVMYAVAVSAPQLLVAI
jgi:hypothetical protein